MTEAVHRVVERRASMMPEAVAIVHGERVTTYRELNHTANTLARRLHESGLRRGALAIVRMPRGTELAAVLLAVLKAGAAYTWIEPGRDDEEADPSFSVCGAGAGTDREQQFLALDIDAALRHAAGRPGPNLPVLTRGADIACVLRDRDGHPRVLVPHATITALPRTRTLRHTWEGSAGALDLWAALMSGATLSLGTPSSAAAAA